MNIPLSKINPILTLDYILNKKEDIYFERKGVFKPNGQVGITVGKLVSSIIGMLNAEGGSIILGVNNKNIEDVKSVGNTKFQDFKQVTLDIAPPCNIEIEEVEIDGKTILIYHINLEKERVFSKKDNEKVYLRKGDETRELNREEVKKLEYDRHTRAYEDEIVYNFDEEDFKHSVIEYYRKKVGFTGDDFRELLKHRGLANKKDGAYTYTKAAVLLFSKYPEKYIPSASLRYIRFDGIKQEAGTEINIIKDERFEECIPRIIEITKRFLNNVFRDYYVFDIQTGKFIKVSEYPEEAWLEGIVNALTHRSYNLHGNVIYIKHFDDRIEISNSGPLPATVTIENITETRYARNPKIAKVLYDFGYVREINEGAKRIYRSMEKSLLPKPIYTDRHDIVTLTLKNKITKNDDTISESTMKKIEDIFPTLNSSRQEILNCIIINKRLNLEDIKSYIDLGEKTIRNYLNEFIDKGILVKDGGKRDKNADYILKK